MKKIICFLFIAFIICRFVSAQMTMKITAVPQYFTPLLDTIFVAATFNAWNPGDTAFQFIKQADGSFILNLEGTNGDTVEFKFTHGDWDRGETHADGSFLPNRSEIFSNGDTNLYTIENWQDETGNHTIDGNVIMLDYNFFMPQLNKSRRVWIYLPPGYEISLKYYPVIYIQDGQNDFDDATSYIGEWGIDETVENLIAAGHTEAIIVGIANGEGDRIDEYSPWINATYGGGDGDAYAEFIVSTLKPYMDANYRTLPDRENTAIGGSSLGAFISYYMTLAYDSVFAKAFIFSPSFWFNDSVNTITENFVKTLHTKIYITAGEYESETIVDEIDAIVNTLHEKGFTDDELISVIRSDGAHSEWFWKREYDDAYLWLFEDVLPLNIQYEQDDFGFVYDVQNQIAIISMTGNLNYILIDMQGKRIGEGAMQGNQIHFTDYKTGLYLLQITNGSQNFTSKILIQ